MVFLNSVKWKFNVEQYIYTYIHISVCVCVCAHACVLDCETRDFANSLKLSGDSCNMFYLDAIVLVSPSWILILF